MRVRSVMTLAVGFLLSAPVYAQNPYGRITGRVLDASGAVIPGATVRLVNLDTNMTSTSTSNAEGNYDVQNLVPGRYRLEVQAQGFKGYNRSPIEVRVGDVLSLEITMELGAVAESLTVTEEAPILESASSSLGQVVDNRRVLDLPLPGGNPMYLTQLASGVISTNAPTHGWMPLAQDSASDIATAGTRSRSSEFTLDGIPNMTQSGMMAFIPPPEMVQEFRVQTAAFDASIGHFTGAHVNMVIKGGTNTPHGNLFFRHVSRPLMTRDFFTNKFIFDPTTGPITAEKKKNAWPYTRTDHYRATVSGPLYLPKLYDGRNRTFLTYGVDVVDRLFNQQGTFTVPTARQRSGDFSELLAIGPQYQIYDPYTIAPAPGGRFSRQPLPGNVIPASRIDPMAKRLVEYYALPNTAGTIDGRNNYSDPQPFQIDYHSQTFRTDQIFSERERLFATLTWGYDQELLQRTFHNIARGQIKMRRHRGFALDNVLMIRPDLVLDIRYGLTRFISHMPHVSFGFDLATLGFPASLVNELDKSTTTFPEIAPEGYTSLGGTSASRAITNYHTLSAVASQLRGNHSLRFGGEFRALQENAYNYGYVSPQMTFGTLWTRGPLDSSPASPIGQGFASFLFGLPTSGYIDKNPSYAEQSRYAGWFLQDDWKATRKLTVNLGLRHEVEFPTTERYNRANRGFDFTSANPVEAAARANYARSPIPEVPADQFRIRGGLLFAGVRGAPRGLWDTDWNNISPRIGLAYLLRPQTVVRAGYGIFFESLGADRADVSQQGFSQRTTLVPSVDNGLTFQATLGNPFPAGLLKPAGAAGGLATFLGRAPNYFMPERRNGYMQRWSLNIQQELPHRILVEVGYLGNRGTKLGLSEDYDPVPARYLSTSPVRDQAVIDYLSRAVPNPFYGLPEFSGSNLEGRTVSLAQLLRPYPHFTGINTTSGAGFSWYHALQIRAEKRFSHGYTLQASYTWSKFMEAVERLNPTDDSPHHVISPHDRPHHIVVSGIYELPFGRNRRWLSGGGWKDRLLGGWSVQGIYQGQSGPPIGFGNIAFYGDLHDIVLPRSQRTVERWFNTEAGFERDPRKQLASNIRTFPLRLTGLRADGFNNWDLSAFKSFRLRERLTLQLRAEAQDAFNHAMFSAPNTTPTSTLFGSVSSLIWGEQRRIFAGAKLSW